MNRSIVLALVVLAAAPAAMAGNRERKDAKVLRNHIATLPLQTVDDAEKADLQFLREEEKLARDVYLALERTWGLRVFKNIAKSEQLHMDAVLGLLERYSVADPAAGNGEGVFSDRALAALYDELVEKGRTSLEDALVVGATIEDMDIADLEENLERTDNEDLTTVYRNLLRGSRNHLRAFARTMDRYDVSYEPRFIAPEEYEAIVTSSRERGAVDADGNRVRNRKGRRGRS